LLHSSVYGELGDIDLQKQFIVDVWDWDPPPFKHDFMGYMEVSTEQLLRAAQNGQPLPLLPPPAPHKQNVGCIYVDKAVLATPKVQTQQASDS
jgi:hypothetical protein